MNCAEKVWPTSMCNTIQQNKLFVVCSYVCLSAPACMCIRAYICECVCVHVCGCLCVCVHVCVCMRRQHSKVVRVHDHTTISRNPPKTTCTPDKLWLGLRKWVLSPMSADLIFHHEQNGTWITELRTKCHVQNTLSKWRLG